MFLLLAHGACLTSFADSRWIKNEATLFFDIKEIQHEYSQSAPQFKMLHLLEKEKPDRERRDYLGGFCVAAEFVQGPAGWNIVLMNPQGNGKDALLTGSRDPGSCFSLQT